GETHFAETGRFKHVLAHHFQHARPAGGVVKSHGAVLDDFWEPGIEIDFDPLVFVQAIDEYEFHRLIKFTRDGVGVIHVRNNHVGHAGVFDVAAEFIKGPDDAELFG